MKKKTTKDIDNLLLESIEPEVAKALKKLKNKQALKLHDIMVLLLKSQFNHIQHIDKEQTLLKKEFYNLKNEFNTFKEDITNKFNTFKDDITNKFNTFKEDITNKFNTFKEDITNRFQQLEVNIYKSQVNLIKWIVATLVALGLISKIIDKFL